MMLVMREAASRRGDLGVRYLIYSRRDHHARYAVGTVLTTPAQSNNGAVSTRNDWCVHSR